MQISPVILSTGSFVPDTIITNDELKQFPSAFLPMIELKTGVKARRFAGKNQCTSDLAILAARQCLNNIKFDPKDLDAIVLATSSPDRIQPATATRVQHEIGATTAFCFDINAVCSGGVFALAVAEAFIRSRYCKNVLVIASEIYSIYLNPSDFSTFPYFGDGAGAVLVSAMANTNKGIIQSILKTDGSKADVIQIPAGGTMLPYKQLTNPNDIYFKMVGREVYDFAINKGAEIIKEIILRSHIRTEEIKFVISHQANINIIKEIALRTEIALSKFTINLDKYGNTAAASVFISLDELFQANNVKNGDLILIVTFGGGLSWGAILIRM